MRGAEPFLTVADAGWAHPIGIVALFAFIALGFLAVAPSELAQDNPRRPSKDPAGPGVRR